jgi:preprotein translocase subunit SecD
MPKTKVEGALAAAEQAHADDPERAALLRRTRQFKASWIELAEALTESRRRGDFRRWGYDSFEEYTRRELFLRQETVDKLTGSFLFLKKRAPEVLTRDGLSNTIPSYQVVDFLRRAETESDAPQSTVEQIRKRVLEEGAGLPSVVREFKDTVFPVDPGQKKERDLSALLNVAKRLRELLDETDVVPRKLGSEVEKTLDRLLEALRNAGERAA